MDRVKSTLLVMAAIGVLALMPAAHAQTGLSASELEAATLRTRQIVDAADTFLDTLTPDQRAAATFAFNDAEQRQRWSNFPDGTVPRDGIRWGGMNLVQRTELFNLLGTVLSPAGVRMIDQVMEAEQILFNTPPPAQRAALFGLDYYWVAFLGEPSTTEPWMLQFTGHHYSLNATIVGPRMTISPTLSGGGPLKFVSQTGAQVSITQDELTAAYRLLESFTPEQRQRVVLGSEMIQLVLGPGHDGKVLQPEGLAAAEMTAEQKQNLLALVEARLGIMNPQSLALAMGPIRANLDQIHFAWFGPTEEAGMAYFRITGPTIIMEYAPQVPDVRLQHTTLHTHNMYRDPTNEYGSAWISTD